MCPADPTSRPTVVLAAAAHPDDIEFMMAGTLLLLADAGAAVHMWNLASGSCGTATHRRDELVRLRWAESQASAAVAGAEMIPPLADDFALYYGPGLLARAAAVVRRVRPDILLVPSPADYMEDHTNACRLLVTAAFVRGMPNFAADPPTEPVAGDEGKSPARVFAKSPTPEARGPVQTQAGDVVIYHASPYGLRDGLRRLVRPGQFVDIAGVLARKRRMLACHRSQKEWLDVSQGLDAYLNEMESMARQVGQMSGRFEFAEGWRRHSHLGFARSADVDPLGELLGAACWTDPAYEASLESGSGE